MADEDTTPEPKPEPEQTPAGEPVPKPEPPAETPEPEPSLAPDVETLLAAERTRLQAETDAKIEAARVEAVAAERARVAEESRLAALTEAERETERQRLAEEARLRLAAELEQSKIREQAKVAEAAETERRLALANALAESDLRLARGADGSTDPALRELVFGKAAQLVAASDGKLGHAAALAELAKTSPWMFARPDGPAASTTSTGNPGAPAARAPSPPPVKLDPLNNDQDHKILLLEIARRQRS